MALSLAGKTDAELQRRIQAMVLDSEAHAAQLAAETGGDHTNGALYRVTFVDGDGGVKINDCTVTFVDRYGLAPGATNGPAARSFTFEARYERRDSVGYYVLSVGAAGTLVDGTYADQKFATATNQTLGRLPRATFTTDTGGVCNVKSARFNSSGTATAATLTAADPVVMRVKNGFIHPLHQWANLYLPTDFDA